MAKAAVITRRQMLGVPALWVYAAATAWARAETSPIRVVASFSILADLLRNVGADRIHVETLVGPDTDAHVFEPRPSDARSLAEAELVLVNGLGFEGWMDRLIRASGTKASVVVVSTDVSPRMFGGQPDPHAWQNLANAMRYVRNIVAALSTARPAAASQWQANAEGYIARLANLDRQVHSRFDAIPRDRRRVMTSHDAFGYFGASYGVDFIAPLGMSTDGDPSAATVAKLVRQIRDQAVRAVFIENIADPRLVERIAGEAGIAAGGRLYSDALSRPGSEADSYLKLFAHNASVIASSLEAKC